MGSTYSYLQIPALHLARLLAHMGVDSLAGASPLQVQPHAATRSIASWCLGRGGPRATRGQPTSGATRGARRWPCTAFEDCVPLWTHTRALTHVLTHKCTHSHIHKPPCAIRRSAAPRGSILRSISRCPPSLTPRTPARHPGSRPVRLRASPRSRDARRARRECSVAHPHFPTRLPSHCNEFRAAAPLGEGV